MTKILVLIKKHLFRIFVVLAVTLLGFVVYRKLFVKPKLVLVHPEYRDLNQTISLSGQVLANNYALLRFQTNGRLSYLNVKEGDSVNKGKALASLDSIVDLNTSLNNAYNTWLAADAKAKKIEDDVKGHDSDETYSQKNDRVAAQTARDSAYANWQLAKKNLQSAILIAPFSGIVTNINNLIPGSSISLMDSYIELLDPKTLYFSAEVDETDLSKIALNQKAVIHLDAYSDVHFDSSISFISYAPKSDASSTVYEIKFNLPSDDNIRYGLNGDAQILIASASSSLSLPLETIHQDNSHPYVEVIRNGQKSRQQIETGIETDDFMQILSGLTVQDQVIVPQKDAKKK